MNFRNISTVFFSFFIILSAHGKYIKGEGRFYANPDDSLAFIKNQLLNSAFQDVLSKELKEMGLASDLFWTNYNKKFDEYFDSIHEELKDKYKDKDGKISDRRNYEKELRHKRLVLKSNFGQLTRLISSYSVIKMSRSTHMANNCFISVKAKVKSNDLSKVYYQYIRVGTERDFKTLFLTTTFRLDSGTWSDVGVQNETDFTSVVQEHWQQKLREILGPQELKIVLTNQDYEEKLTKYVSMPRNLVEQLQKHANLGNESDSREIAIRPEGDALQDSLWLNINMTLTKVGLDAATGNIKFSLAGGIYLRETAGGKIVDFDDFDPAQVTFSTKDSHSLSSNIASLVYGLPMTKIGQLPKIISSIRSLKKITHLVVQGANSVNEVFQIGELLQNKGATLQLEAKILAINEDKSVISVEYVGEEQAFFEFLRAQNGLELNADRRLELDGGQNTLLVKLTTTSGTTRPRTPTKVEK